MPPVTLKAHFDGTHITLDEPFELQPGMPLTVTVLPVPLEIETAVWVAATASGLARAYSDDEPDYSLADIKP